LIEVEAKYKVEGIHLIEEKLYRLGAELVKEVNEEDYYFNHPCRDFRETDEALRVRVKDDIIELTYKGPKLSSRTKSRVEVSVHVKDSLSKILDMLKYLGFRQVAIIRKHRKLFKLGDYRISLDRVHGLGDFIEIEVLVSEKNMSAMEEKVLELARKLGLKGNPILKSYLELFLEKELSTSTT